MQVVLILECLRIQQLIQSHLPFKDFSEPVKITTQTVLKPKVSKRKSLLNGDLNNLILVPKKEKEIKVTLTLADIQTMYKTHAEEYIESILLWHSISEDTFSNSNFANDVLCEL